MIAAAGFLKALTAAYPKLSGTEGNCTRLVVQLNI